MDRPTDKLAVILHADVAGSTSLVRQDERLAHERIQDSFVRFSSIIEKYRGKILELRGDALLADFERASDAVSATLAFQADQAYYLSRLKDEIKPGIRVGIAMGEVVIADNTVTGAGVVLAQRVEQLSETGSLCITAALHEALPDRMPFDLENIGERSLKGFDDPVRVYRVELSQGASIPLPPKESQPKSSQSPWKPKIIVALSVITIAIGIAYLFRPVTPMEEPASIERMAFPLPDKPSIAVLPFTNMSDDPKQEYFVDGMTEDLITDISKVSGLFVIARNSVFTYKGKAVKVRQVAEELGVRYVLEGSVRRVENQIRINAQLIDATTGGHIWADRYDGSLDDVFSMQDKITQKIVTELSVTLLAREQSSQEQVETNSAEAHDAFLQGWAHFQLSTPDDAVKAISYLETAIKLDPNYGRAHAALAATYWEIGTNEWTDRIGVSHDVVLEKVNRHMGEAMKNPTPLAHRILAKQHEADQRWNKAITQTEQAIVLDPNNPDGYEAMGSLLISLGQAEEGFDYIDKAMRLDPQTNYLYRLGETQFHLERYDEAAATMLRATKLSPQDEWNFFLLAATLGHLGRKQEAHSAVTKFNKIRFDRELGEYRGALTLASLDTWTFNKATNRERLQEGLRKAGVLAKPLINIYKDLVTVSAGTFDVEGAIVIDAAEAKVLHDNGIAFIDSRGKSTYDRGHIPDAINLLLHQVWDDLADIVDQDVAIVFYCGDPKCHLAAHSSAQALTLGYTRVYYFAGGFLAWEAAGYPVEGP